MGNCKTCKHWQKFNYPKPEKPVTTRHKFLWWTYEAKPDPFDILEYEIEMHHHLSGNCSRFPKSEKTLGTHYCSEYQGSNDD